MESLSKKPKRVCKFFAQGRCKFGDDCEFKHIKKKENSVLLCLDINGTLAFRTARNKCVRRPHLKEFLQFIFDNYNVALWTSATKRNMLPCIRHILGNYVGYLKTIHYRGACTKAPTKEKPWRTLKDMNKIGKKYKKVIVIDDSPEKIIHSHNSVYVYIKSFEEFDPHDRSLLGLIEKIKNLT